MRYAVLAALAFLVALGFVLRVPARHADAAVPHNYLDGLTCTTVGDVTAEFVPPSDTELAEQFGSAPSQFWIDLSLADNNFAHGTFIGYGPLQAQAPNTFDRWFHLQPAAVHYYRLNGLFGGRWREIGRGVFETPNCGFVTEIGCDLTGSGLQNVGFAIPPASPIPGLTAREEWIDLTLFSNPRNSLLDNGFLRGTFIGAGPFPPQGGQFLWRGIVSARQHHYRLNTRYAPSGVWVTQLSGSFLSLDCRDLPRVNLPNP
jgi:hypothetical protein